MPRRYDVDDPSVTRYRALLPHRRSVYLAFDGKVDFGQSVHDILVNNIVVGGSEYFQRNCLLSEALGGVQVPCTEVWDHRLLLVVSFEGLVRDLNRSIPIFCIVQAHAMRHILLIQPYPEDVAVLCLLGTAFEDLGALSLHVH